MAQLRWTQTDENHWVSTNGRYRLEQNTTTGNVFIIYRVTPSRNLARGEGHYDALLGARYSLAAAKKYANDHHRGTA
jgi:hypothetical protein